MLIAVDSVDVLEKARQYFLDSVALLLPLLISVDSVDVILRSIRLMDRIFVALVDS